ncbi:MAG: hypothetical protein FJ004_07105 [Chloroflexi bacterium]|nr:hypothetical protein [Chloroflexota bacterium]
MTIAEDLTQMEARITSGEPAQRQRRIKIYTGGVSAKIRQADIALAKIKELLNYPDDSRRPQDGDYIVEDLIHFYVDAYFAFLYSNFDIISQVVSQKMQLPILEDKVKFYSVNKELCDNHLGTPIQLLYQRLTKSTNFQNLRNYRNCSTHRRRIMMKQDAHNTSVTAEYSQTAPTSRVLRWLCDNPLDLNPNTKQNRELEKYTSKMLIWVKSQISQIANTL